MKTALNSYRPIIQTKIHQLKGPFEVFSQVGAKMARVSGIRSIMEDIATSTSLSTERRWLNLGVGNPAYIPEATATWQRLTEEALADVFVSASSRYGPSRGSQVLVDTIVEYFNNRYGWGIGPQNVVVGPGSQMLCFIASALFTGPRMSHSASLVLPMIPDYTGYQGLCMTPMGVVGIDPEIEKEAKRLFRYRFDFPALERQRDVGLMLLSSPSNPTGRCVDADELDKLISAAERLDAPLIIDNAYGEPFPRIGQDALAPTWHDKVVNCFTLSKAGLPGERVGFAIGHERYVSPMVSFLANSVLHGSQMIQTVVARALASGELDTLVSSVLSPFYSRRRKSAEKLLLDTLPEEINWLLHDSDGGMFCWIWVDEEWFDDLVLYQTLKEREVFIVPGRHFFTEPDGPERPRAHARQCFRISLSTDHDSLTEGIARIADVLHEMRLGRI